MSITNRHQVAKFDSKTSKPVHGQRLAKVGYKSSKKNPAKYPSVCVSIPSLKDIQITEQELESLAPFIIGMLENAQDGIIRSLYEGSDGHMVSISDDDISISSCISYMSAVNAGDRLTKDMLEKWFVENMNDNLTVLIAEKLGYELDTPEQEITVAKHVSGYKDMISSLSGGKTILAPKQIDGLLRALEVSSVDDEISEKLVNRLEKMKNKPSIEELCAL